MLGSLVFLVYIIDMDDGMQRNMFLDDIKFNDAGLKSMEKHRGLLDNVHIISETDGIG